MLIAFEGIDGSGKSFISKKLAEKLNWRWTHEPTFLSEQADALNLGSKDDIQREVEFAVDRICHTYQLNHTSMLNVNTICDRYIWSGLVYCKKYNPAAYSFIDVFYDHKFFIKPDYYIYVETPIQLCYERKMVHSIEHLQELSELYNSLRPKIEKFSKIITVHGNDNVDEIITYIMNVIGNTDFPFKGE